MLSKREWRFRWFIKHGKVPNGWTPPDPKDPHSRKYPKRALAARLPKKYRMLWPVCAPASDSAFLARSISWIDLRSCRSSLGPKLLEKRGFKALGQVMPSRYILDDAQLTAWASG
jgi:hypothetical protein